MPDCANGTCYQLEALKTNQADIKDRILKLEEKTELMYKMSNNIEILNVNLGHVNENVEKLTTELKNNVGDMRKDIRNIENEQEIISSRVSQLDSSNALTVKTVQENKSTKQKIKDNLINTVSSQLVTIVVVIILLALFPHLADIIK